MTDKLNELFADLGYDMPGVMESTIRRDAVLWSFARCLFKMISSSLPDVRRDPVLGHYIFSWTDSSEMVDAALEMLIQPSVLRKLPHSHEDECSDTCEVPVHGYQLFALAFECVQGHDYCQIPTVDENAQTSGPAIFYTNDVFIKFAMPGVK